MPIPIRQNLRIARYLWQHKRAGTERFPLLVEIEPLFACNLACPGAARSSIRPRRCASG